MTAEREIEVWMSLGSILDQRQQRLGRTPIREYKVRHEWAERNLKHSIIALYNTGRNLYYEPNHLRADSHYDSKPWLWIPYEIHSKPGEILASNGLVWNLLRDQILFVTLGHSFDYSCSIMIGSQRVSDNGVCFEKQYTIPRCCILYLGIKYGHVRDSLLIYQPLPTKLFQAPTGPKLQQYGPQNLVAVSKSSV